MDVDHEIIPVDPMVVICYNGYYHCCDNGSIDISTIPVHQWFYKKEDAIVAHVKQYSGIYGFVPRVDPRDFNKELRNKQDSLDSTLCAANKIAFTSAVRILLHAGVKTLKFTDGHEEPLVYSSFESWLADHDMVKDNSINKSFADCFTTLPVADDSICFTPKGFDYICNIIKHS